MVALQYVHPRGHPNWNNSEAAPVCSEGGGYIIIPTLAAFSISSSLIGNGNDVLSLTLFRGGLIINFSSLINEIPPIEFNSFSSNISLKVASPSP